MRSQENHLELILTMGRVDTRNELSEGDSDMERERVNTDIELSGSEADVERTRSTPVPALRKSLRKQQAPAWLRSGDYQCKSVNSSVSQNGWAQKASFLLSLASNDVFKMLTESVSSEILKLVMESK